MAIKIKKVYKALYCEFKLQLIIITIKVDNHTDYVLLYKIRLD